MTIFTEKCPTDFPRASLSANARTILEKRYLLRDADGRVTEGAEDLFYRVARVIADVDRRYGADDEAVAHRARAFYALMASNDFLPNSPTLMNAGRPLGQLSACFVLPIEDALSNGHDGIYDTLRNMALVHQSGGGVGFSFSQIRPKNDVVRSTMGVASGPVTFMSLYDASTDVVKQGGTRRGANMGILRVDHPDILDFISCKDDTSKYTNFNISVGITDVFMAAVEADAEYALIHPRTQEPVGRLRARDVWAKIIHGAWKTGEPGVFFIDRANHFNPVPHLGRYDATNPCGEVPLLPYDVCNLGSINLARFVQAGEIDWSRLREVVHGAIHFLENVVDANKYPLPEIAELAHRIRRIGLGVMGLADLLIALEIPYDSDRAILLGRGIQRFVDEEAKNASEALAAARGTFPEWARSIWGPDETCARDRTGNRIRPMRRLRHCNVTTIAPTGTISVIAGCSSGIEPLFAVAFMRNQAGVLMPEVSERFITVAKRDGWHTDELMHRIAEAGHTRFPEVPERWQRVFVTANTIAPDFHIRMQAAFQEFNDSAISKTCNFAASATVADVETIYRRAFELGCKGVTVYRDGCREMQVLSAGATARKVQAQATATGVAAPRADLALVVTTTSDRATTEAADLRGELAEAHAEADRLRRDLHLAEAENLQRRAKRSRPELLRGTTRRVETPLGTLYVTITEDERGQPFEVFMSLGKAGGALMADVEAVGRLISLALRSGIPMKEIYRQLRGISSDRVMGLGPNKVLSVPDAVGIAIERWMQAQQGIQQELLPGRQAPAGDVAASAVALPRAALVAAGSAAEAMAPSHVAPKLTAACPDCGSQVEHAESCVRCPVCSWSECGN